MIALYGTAADSSGEGPEIMLGTSQVRELNQLIQGMVRDPLEDMPIKGPIPGPDEFDLAALPDDDVLVDEWADSPHKLKVGAGEINCINVVTRQHFTVLDIRGMAEGRQRAREPGGPFRQRLPAINHYKFSETWQGGARTSFWSPPEPLPSLLRGPVAEQVRKCWARGWQAGYRQDPRWLFASRAMRNERESQVHAHILLFGTGTDAPNVLLAGCSWCSQPTGSSCDGVARYHCGIPLCSICDKIFATCRACTCWCGLPNEVPVVGEWNDEEMEAMRRRFAVSSQP
jgi:hypothetical protein